MKGLKLHNCSVEKLVKKVKKESVDIILTDPPYPGEFLYTYKDLANFAVHALKPGGHLLAMAGHIWLPQVFRNMDVEGLTYNWTLSISPLSPNGSCVGRHICGARWKPFLWYFKPPRTLRTSISDVISGGKRDKNHHHWGQDTGVLEHILRILKIHEGSIVCDPFLGGGSTAEAAIKMGMKFIGCDIDKECIKTTKQRLKTIQQELL